MDRNIDYLINNYILCLESSLVQQELTSQIDYIPKICSNEKDFLITDLFVLAPINHSKENIIEVNGIKCVKADICIVDMIKLEYDEGLIEESIKDYICGSINNYNKLKDLFINEGINSKLIDKYLEDNVV